MGSLIPHHSLQPRVYTKINGLCLCLIEAGKLKNNDFSSLVGSFFYFYFIYFLKEEEKCVVCENWFLTTTNVWSVRIGF